MEDSTGQPRTALSHLSTIDALSMMSPSISRNKGLFKHAASFLQSPGLGFKVLAEGMDRALSASLNYEDEQVTKIHFRVNHPPSRPQVDDVQVRMHILGSLKQLGCWDEQRAKTMKRSKDGGWEAVHYLKTGETFEYQYILKDFDGQSVWRSSAERQQAIDDIGHNNTLEIVDFITNAEEETGNLCRLAPEGETDEPSVCPSLPAILSDSVHDQVDVVLASCPSEVDVGRDSSCGLSRDSLLPPPSAKFASAMARKSMLVRGSMSGFEDCRRVSVVPSKDEDYEDCAESVVVPSDNCLENAGNKQAMQTVGEAAALNEADGLTEAPGEERDQADDSASRDAGTAGVGAEQHVKARLDLAAKQIKRAAALLQEPNPKFSAFAAALKFSLSADEDSAEADRTGEEHLVLALTNLMSALEAQRKAHETTQEATKQEHEQLREQALSEQSEQLEQQRAQNLELEAAWQSEKAALQAEREALQAQVAELQEELLDKGAELSSKDDELKALVSQLEEEKELVKMRSRRLRGGIRTVQGQLSGVRAGFDDLRSEVTKMTSAILPELTGMAGKLETSIVQVAKGVQAELDETNGKFQGEIRERKRLHNLVQELKGNIRVFARIRPVSEREKETGKMSVVLCPSSTELSLCAGSKVSLFNYDRVFAQSSTQEEVFEETAPLVVSVLDGYNVCIFAYGQTGSGKTHTMEGSEAARGVNYRSLAMLFELAQERRCVATYEFKVSLLEIYNEQIKDLIETHDTKGELKKLEVKNDPNGGGTLVGSASGAPGSDLKTVTVTCIEDVLDVMATGMRNRSTSSTQMNTHSSRSHCIFSVNVTCTDLLKGGTSFGKMHLVDLAGSERLSRTGAEGDRLTEAKNINKSLSALGNCISALVSKAKFTPYRDSKLTHLLQDSLGGEAKMLMFVCASPCDADVQESKCSLEFATRVGTVELGSARRRGDGGAGAALKEMQNMLKSTKEEASKAGGEKDKLEEELASVKEELKLKTHESTTLLESLRHMEAELSAKDKTTSTLLAAKEKHNAQLLSETQRLVKRLKQVQEQQPPVPAQGHAQHDQGQQLHLAAASNADAEQTLTKSSAPARDVGTHGASATARTSSACPALVPALEQDLQPIAPEASAFGVRCPIKCTDELMGASMTASVSAKIALEAAALVQAVVGAAGEGQGQLCEEAEISFSEAEDKENAQRNVGGGCGSGNYGEQEQEDAALAACEGGAQLAGEIDGGGESLAAETLEERLAKFRRKKEELKKKSVVQMRDKDSAPRGVSTPCKRELVPKKAAEAVESPLHRPTSASHRLSMRSQTAMSRPASAIPRASALSGGAVRPRSATGVKLSGIPSVHEKSGARARLERSAASRVAGWR